MPNDYPSTQVPFDQLDLPRLHDPIVLGPGSGSMEGAADAYRQMAETLENAARDVRAVLTSSMGAHEGDAAEAGREYIRRVAAAGEAGGAAARLAMYALQEQVSYYSRVRHDMEAVAAMPPVPERKWQFVKTTPEERDAPRIMAVDAAHRYENNTNHNLANVYQMFEPPAGSGLEVAAVPPPRHPGSGGGGFAIPPAGIPGPGPDPGLAPPPSPPGPPGTGPDGLPPNTSRPGEPPAAALPGPGHRGNGTPDQAGRNTGGNDTQGRTTPKQAPGPGPWNPSTISPQTRRPGGETVVPPPPPTGSAWTPDVPWSSRPDRMADLPGGRIPGPGDMPRGGSDTRGGAPRPLPAGEASPHGGTPQRTPGSGTQMPFMPMTGAGARGQDTEHRRPSWLVEDDPDSFWLAGLPPHWPAVIEPFEE